MRMSLNEDFQSRRKLVKFYGRNRLLWDTNCPDFYNKQKKESVWREISLRLKYPVGDLKRKMKNLLASYRREYMHVCKDKNYKSKWFGFSWFQFYEEFYSKHKRGPHHISADIADSPAVKSPETLNSSENSASSDNFKNTDEYSISTPPLPQLRPLCPTSQEERSFGTNGHSCPLWPSKKSRIDKDTLVKILLRRKTPDQYDAFGNYLSSELRKYDSRVLPHVKRAIVDVLFKADTGQFNEEAKESDHHALSPSPSIAFNIEDVEESEAEDKIEVFEEKLF